LLAKQGYFFCIRILLISSHINFLCDGLPQMNQAGQTSSHYYLWETGLQLQCNSKNFAR